MDTVEAKLNQGIMSVSEIMELVCTEVPEPIYGFTAPTVLVHYRDNSYFYRLTEQGNFHYFELTLKLDKI